jgi:hypothetical protein
MRSSVSNSGLPGSIDKSPHWRIAMPRIIEVTVSPKGETKLQTKGYIGADCQQASKFLEQALGVSATEQRTGEYYATATTEQRVQQ